MPDEPQPYTDEELLAYVDRQGPEAACQHYRYLGKMIRRLQSERDQAIDDARFLSECAAKLLHGAGELIEEVAENVHDEWQRQLRRAFDPLRIAEVTGRYVDVEPVTVQEHDEAEVANG